MKILKMTATEKITATKMAGGVHELFGVILEQTFAFFMTNFVKEGKISLPKLVNPFFIYAAAKYVIKLVSIIKLYKEDCLEFKRLYVDKTTDISEIDKLFKVAS